MLKYSFLRKTLFQILNLGEKVLLIIGIWLFGAVIVVNALEIFFRTVLNHSFYWVQEFTVIICIYIIFMGASLLFKRKENIFISVFFDRLPTSIKPIISIINDILILFFLIVGIKSSYNYLIFVYGGYTQTMKIPMYIMYLPILLSFVYIFISVLGWLTDDIEHYSQQYQ